MAHKTWFPLESNPTVMNTYMRKLGMNTEKYTFHDVYSTEDWAMEMVPRPVIAVLMLYPITSDSEKFSHEQQTNIKTNGQIVSNKVKFIKQTIGNACGTIALLHASSNGKLVAPELVTPDSYLAKFEGSIANMSSEEIADFLEEDKELEVTHEAAAEEGDTEQITEEEDVDTHFICFSQVDGHLYELDGRKEFPINHGPSSEDNLLEDACKVIVGFMARQPGELRFTIVALCEGKAEGEEDNDAPDEEEVMRESDSNRVD